MQLTKKVSLYLNFIFVSPIELIDSTLSIPDKQDNLNISLIYCECIT